MTPARSLLLALVAGLLLAVAPAPVGGPGPLAAQNPFQEALDPSSGEGSQEGSGQEGQEEGEEENGLLPEAPPKPMIPTEEILSGEFFRAETWRVLGRKLLEKFIDWLPSLIAAVLILVVFFVLYRLTAGLLRGFMGRTRADPAAQSITLRLTRYTMIGLALVMAASQLGIDIGALIAGVGILGLAIGLAAQDSLANLVAGITILWDRPFRIGDNVTVSDTFGKVKEIGLRTTRIRTVEQLDAILPNKEIINQKLVNHTLNPMMRLGVPLGIAYKEDSRQARKVLLAAVEGHELILEQPEPQVVVTALGDSSVNLELRVWLRDPHAEREATFAMVELAKIALDEAGIEIPFPQRTLHLPGAVRVEKGGAEREGEE